MSRLLRAIALIVLSYMFLVAHVWAHAHLQSAQPADQAVVVAPAELHLHFSEGLNLPFSGIKLTGPGAQDIKLGAARLMEDGNTLMVPLPVRLAPGGYTVDWHALSVDGHKTSGSYQFSVAP